MVLSGMPSNGENAAEGMIEELGVQFAAKEKIQDVKLNFAISGITFDVLSPAEIVKYSAVRVVQPRLYSGGTNNKPMPFGPMDLHMGANRADRNRESGRCLTCHGTWDECVGHWGYVQLPYPVFHSCGKLLLDDDQKASFLRRMRKHAGDSIVKMRIFKSLVETSKKLDQCRFCDSPQGALRRINQGTPDKFLKVQHEVKIKEGKERGMKVVENLDAAAVLKLVSEIPPEDRETLYITKPENLLLSTFPVPPSSIRPSINLGDAGTNEDDLSITMKAIVEVATEIRRSQLSGLPSHSLAGLVEALQILSVCYLNSDYPQLENALHALAANSRSAPKTGRGVSQRLKGKEGRFRGNLSGKRVDFSGRTVISPDPNCPIPCVVVPMWSAMRLTFPERVTSFNVAKLRTAVINGPDEWPGALSISRSSDGFKTSLRYVNKRQAAANLQLGDIVERHLWNDDVVLFNRQPSLHRLSIMAHRARVMPWRTLRFNECVCSPYNADFDGDEMNCHLPQTHEARAEALHLMGVTNNLTTPKNGEPLIAATQDFLSGSWMICHKDVFLTRDQLCLFCCYFSDGLYQIDIPPPAILKPIELWTGKQLFNILLRPNRKAKVALAFELKERDFEKPKNGEPLFMCPRDGYILVYQSELMCGAMGKKVLGGGSKEGLFFHLIRNNTPQVAAEIMGRVAKLTGRWFANRGMTIGIDDVTPSDEITELKGKLLEKGYEEVSDHVKNYNSGQMTPDPGCDLGQTLEIRSKAVLDDLRTKAGELSIAKLDPLNKPLIMFLSGAKGALINMAQMIALVGQQNVNGKRIWDGFVRRTLPHYAPDQVKSPRAKGFVANSFYTGLTPDEFFFHTMSGREGLVDTAVKTADTGYMQRRLVKALEDLSVKYDRTVRTSDGQVVQFTYGDDGLNPQLMERKTDLVDLDQAFKYIKSVIRYSPLMIREHFRPYRDKKRITVNSNLPIGNSSRKRLKSSILMSAGRISLDGEDNTVSTGDSTSDLEYIEMNFLSSPIVKIDDPDVILPPATELPCLHYLRDFLSNMEPDQTFPKSLKQKISFVLCCLKSLYPSENPKDAAIRLLGVPLEDVKNLDPLLQQARLHILCHLVVWRWLPRVKRETPLLPYEFLQWANWIVGLTEEMQPESVKYSERAARKEEPTHQKRTETLRNFQEEVRSWLKKKADILRKVREDNGECGALTEQEYKRVIILYRQDVKEGRCSKPEELKNPMLQITNPLERRLWLVPTASMILKDAESEDISRGPRTEERFDLTGDDEDTSSPERIMLANTQRKRWRISMTNWITVNHLLDFCRHVWRKYNRALIEPGEAVGAIGAQSIGEPGTQMTLKTFHFAGVASMNVTLGVPRIKEIINAASKIMTPIITVPLTINKDRVSFAQLIRGMIESTTLAQICSYIKHVVAPEGTWIVIRLCRDAIQANFLEINADTVISCIENDPGSIGKTRLRDLILEKAHDYKIIVRPPKTQSLTGLSFQIRALMDGLLKIKVGGIPTIRRSVIQKNEKKSEKNEPYIEYSLAVEGTGLREIMAVDGVDGVHVGCNNVMEVNETLGIEAARQVIISEIKGCMDAYSMDIDIRHMQLLGDVMTFRGEVLGISRFGIQKMRASVLCLASFEETNEHLFEAAVHKKTEHVQGVSEAIILGKRVLVGTGAFEVLQAPKGFDTRSQVFSRQNQQRKSFLLARLKQASSNRASTDVAVINNNAVSIMT